MGIIGYIPYYAQCRIEIINPMLFTPVTYTTWGTGALSAAALGSGVWEGC